ncbi:spondin-1 [Agrilus planipennis]|uniref:Spondin-1 n=1 Tax=Agrilus planipennis TaxID=224129 RepID=A0A1W4XFH7_AGRPL|nr:spondin-1 [Agrilus planipennis]
MILKFLLFSLLFGTIFSMCPRVPSPYHSRRSKLPGDNGYKIKIQGGSEKYVPGEVYAIYLMGSRAFNNVQHFKRFIINVESVDQPGNISPQKVGSFQLFGDNLSKFNEDCVNTVSETNSLPKTEVFVLWTAPPTGSGCVVFRAMVLEDSSHWYADDGELSKTLCERTEKDIKYGPQDCCACDEAKYNLIFEGIWSKETHPKDYPLFVSLTHFSDVIGASHVPNFTFWGEGQIATEGFKSLAEWGSVRLMESELKAQSKHLRTIIKANGLWYPKVNTNTSTNFKVDRKHNLISVASMFGPSPDWVVGVNSLNLCLPNCTWMDRIDIDLYPWDAGTDSGISYMSPNAETSPREKMYRITTTYPEDPRAPFYDPSKSEMNPLAKLYIRRDRVIPRNCDDDFLTAQVDISENTEDTNRPECAVTEFSEWSACSVTCGKGLRMRSREYVLPQKALMFQCNRQLISKEMCVAAVPECEGGRTEPESEEQIIEGNDDICSASPWSEWSECSSTCDIGFQSRYRSFKDVMAKKKCSHIQTYERQKCMGPPCSENERDIPDPMCPVTEWNDWGPCSSTCGKGVKLRTRLLLVEPGLQEKCSSRVEIVQTRPCVEKRDCTFDMATAKQVCMEESEAGPCNGYFNRWYFVPSKQMCIPFVYGGCRGNRNNFMTREECMEQCKVVIDILSGNAGNVPVHPPVLSQQFNGYPVEGNEPVDCMVTEWSEWTPCSVSCGTGFTEKRRMVKRPSENGGKPCPDRLLKRKRCRGPPCA